MSWHDALSLEVEIEFLRFMPHWDVYENAIWFARHARHVQWADNGKHWRRSMAGRKQARAYMKDRYRLLMGTPDGWSKCKACGCQFEISVMQRRKGRTVCSLKCAGALSQKGARTEPATRPTMTPTQSEKRKKARVDRYGILMATPDGMTTCRVCGRSFAVSVIQRRKKISVCGYACSGALSSQNRAIARAASSSVNE